MQMNLAIGILATLFWAFSVSVHAGAALATFIHPALRRRAALRRDRPAVSVVIPVKNVEPELEQAFLSVFAQDYPAFEVLISAAEEASGAIDVARKVSANHPRVPCRFVLGNRSFTLNPKISNLAPAIAAAAHRLILVKDANIQLGAGQLDDLVANLTPGTGMVCAIPLAVRPRTFWAEVEAAEMNGRSAPLMAGASLIGIDVGFGKVMLFDRGDFDRVDGVNVMAGTFGDDHALTKALHRIGKRTVFAGTNIRQAMGARTFRAIWERQLRWMVIRRDEAPLVFFAEVFFGCLLTTLLGAVGFACLGLPALPIVIATPVFWLARDVLVVTAKGWGWYWGYPAAAICREFLLVAWWLRAWFSRKVTWAGEPFEVRPKA